MALQSIITGQKAFCYSGKAFCFLSATVFFSLWLALTTNQKHGLRRSRADLQRIVRLALLHPNGADLSDREIARHCGVSDKTVGKIRSTL